MDWLMHNPVADMYGPQFLVLYGSVIALTLAVCWWKLGQRDPTLSMPVPLVPSQPDPLEIAYLRGGENEVTRVVVIGLTQRGYLRMTEEKKWFSIEQRIERALNHPAPRHLSQLERCVFEWFHAPHTAQEIFQSETLLSEITRCCAPYEQRLYSEQLLMPPEGQNVARKIMLKGALVVIGLGGYKLLVALAKGRSNVWFLIIMGIVSLVVLYKICSPPRLSAKGQAYLKQLQLAFERLKEPALRVSSGASDTALLLLVGVFGVAALAGTPYAYYQDMFSRGSSRWGGGWGGEWGGGCGGGCGGGGCGGGGCGGCGG